MSNDLTGLYGAVAGLIPILILALAVESQFVREMVRFSEVLTKHRDEILADLDASPDRSFAAFLGGIVYFTRTIFVILAAAVVGESLALAGLAFSPAGLARYFVALPALVIGIVLLAYTTLTFGIGLTSMVDWLVEMRREFEQVDSQEPASPDSEGKAPPP